MNFIKKNWALLLCTFIFLVLMGALGFLIFSESKKYVASEAAIAKLDKNFNDMNKWEGGVRIDSKRQNAVIAESNAEIAKNHYDEVAREIYKRYSFEVGALPPSSSAAQESIRRVLEGINRDIVKNKIIWREQRGIPGDFFIDLSEQPTPIPEADFPAIFRQLQIYKKLVNHVIAAKIKVVNTIKFPRQLTSEASGDYTITPIIISVESEQQNIQNLVNRLSADQTMLLFIRSIGFSTPAAVSIAGGEFNRIVSEKTSASSSDLLGGGESRRDGMRSAGAMGARSSSNNDSKSEKAGYVEESAKRQDYLVFRSPYIVRINLNLDLIEFKNPTEN